ncbi:MAG: 4-oxalocrotonate tautomerase DmpI [Candidatus Tenebribacter burtonii]|jgi:4-oxalocrotonate tautomerase|nr:4-oxalocrotonate tautomerase DmpI [Candidatus Tenebribacter burtonii]
MPIITLENAGTLTVEQKTQLIKKLTDVVVEVTNKSASAVYVRIDEVPRENFGVGGKSLG